MLNWIYENLPLVICLVLGLVVGGGVYYEHRDNLKCAADPECSIMIRVREFRCTASHEVSHGKTRETVCDTYQRIGNGN